MALKTQFGYMDGSEAISFSAFTVRIIDASGEKYAAVFRVPKTGNITKVMFRVIAATTPQTLRASLQTVDMATGEPTGTLYGGSASGTQTSPAANTSYLVTLGTQASATAGDYVALVVEFDSTVGNMSIGCVAGAAYGLPYGALYTGTWAKTADTPIAAIEYDDGSYPTIFGIPYSGSSTVAVSFSSSTTSGSGGDERGLRFSVPFPCSLFGMIVSMNIAAGADFDFVVYDEGSNVIASQSFDGNVCITGTALQKVHCQFSSPVNLLPNATYRATIKPTTTTSLSMYEFNFLSTAAMESFYRGNRGYRTVRTDGGAWTDTTTAGYQMALIYSAFDNGSSTDFVG